MSSPKGDNLIFTKQIVAIKKQPLMVLTAFYESHCLLVCSSQSLTLQLPPHLALSLPKYLHHSTHYSTLHAQQGKVP